MPLFSRSEPAPDLRPRLASATGEHVVTRDHRVVLADLTVRCVPRPPDPQRDAGDAPVVPPRGWPEDDERSVHVLVVTLLRVLAQERSHDELTTSRAKAVARLDLALSLAPVLGGWVASVSSLEWRASGGTTSRSTWQVAPTTS